MFVRGLILALTLTTAPFTPPVSTLPPLVYSFPAGSLTTGRNFLAFDPTGDGRAVEVVGNLETARRIVILVPGNDTTLDNFDRGLGGVARRAPAVQARAVHQAVRRVAADPGVAVVAWLGYDSPEGMGMATVRQERARAGAVELQRFVASLPSAATVVIVGHSYGSIVAGLAAPGFGPAVTDIVALASPGMGVSSAAELQTRARVWAGTSDKDWIRFVPHVTIAGFGHGADPTDPDFGARPVPTDNVSNHDSYLVPGSATLAAVAGIALTGEV